MENLEKKLLDNIKMLKDKYAKNSQVLEFEKSNLEFDKLVAEGYIKKRGNNLLSPTDAHIKNRVWFNAKI